MGIESLALDAEGEYSIVAESLGGINVVLSPTSKTIINLFDLEPEIVKDEITENPTNDDIDNVIKKMDFAQINVLGFIINGIKIKRSGKYYSGGSYYYRKGYGYYGAKEEPETEEKDKEKDKK